MITDIGDASDDAELGLLDGNTGTNDILNRDKDGHQVQEQIGGTGSDEAETLYSVIEFLEIHLARNQQMDIQTNVRQSVFFFFQKYAWVNIYLPVCLLLKYARFSCSNHLIILRGQKLTLRSSVFDLPELW